MASKMTNLNFLYFLPLLCIANCLSSNDVSNDKITCQEKCANTFPLHTYPNSEHLTSCFRGCRLFSIIDTVEDFNDANATRVSCLTSCKDAYGEDNGSVDACGVGCCAQEPLFSPLEHYLISQIDELFRPSSFDTSIFFPFMYVRSDSFTNIIDKVGARTQVSWSFYIENDDGKMLVIRSQPHENEFGDMTENYMETNIEPMDGSATPNLPQSPFFGAKAYRLQDRDLQLSEQETNMDNSDWLSCISHRTGLSRMFLTFTIFVSAMGMIWLAISTTVTASEQRITRQPEQLSFYGDLEYIKKGFMTKVEPIGPDVQAPPLPIKMAMQEI